MEGGCLMPFIGQAPASEVLDGSITSSKLASDSVTTAKISSDAVSQASVADEAVDEARIQISNAGTNGQFLSKQSGNTGGLTWADTTGWEATTEGRVTTSQGQDDIDFTIPADVNMIKVVFWGVSQVPNDNPFLIRYGTTDGTLVTSGYLNTSTYWYNGASPSLTENTDGIKLNGWNSTSNYWYGEINFSSVGQDGRRWYYHMNAYNDTYGEYFSMAHGRIALSSGQQVRKIRFTCASTGGYDSGGQIKTYTVKL